jgi:transposase
MPLTVVVDNANLQKAKKVQHWMAAHPRFELLELPPYCPAAHPMERAGGEVHDKGTRNHPRTRLWPRGGEVKHPLRAHGPWRSVLSALSSTPEVTAAVHVLKTADSSLAALSQLAA